MTAYSAYRSYAIPLLYLILLSAFSPGKAQTCSCAGAPLTNSLGIGTVSPKPWQIQLQYDVHSMKHLVSDSEVLEVGQSQRQTQTGLLQVTRTLSPRLQATLVASWVRQSFEAGNEISSSGVGDIILLGQYRILGGKGDLQGLYLGAGLTIPTGSTEQTAGGLLLGPDLQPGTGAWDGLASLLYTNNGLWNAKSGLQASLTYRITSKAQRFQNKQTYQFGPELLFQGSVYQQVKVIGQQITAALLLRYRRTKHDLIDGRQAFNTGGQWLNIGGGLNWAWNDWLSLQANAFFPAYRNLKGVQLTSSSRINLGLVLQLPANGRASAPQLPTTGK